MACSTSTGSSGSEQLLHATAPNRAMQVLRPIRRHASEDIRFTSIVYLDMISNCLLHKGHPLRRHLGLPQVQGLQVLYSLQIFQAFIRYAGMIQVEVKQALNAQAPRR